MASLTEDERWKTIRYIQEIFAQPFEHDPQEGDPTGEYVGVTNPLPLNIENLQAGKAIFSTRYAIFLLFYIGNTEYL